MKFLRGLFKKETNVEILESMDIPNHCDKCETPELCIYKPLTLEPCDYIVTINDYNENKKTFLIIDDNPGVSNFLSDDLEYIKETYKFDFNIITICGRHAVFHLEKILMSYKIHYAIIDLTFGGAKVYNNKIIKYSGVDAFKMLYNNNSRLKLLFYTGNSLNAHIKQNRSLIDEFQKIHGTDIKDHILYKTSMGMDDRRNTIYKQILGDLN